MILPSYPCTSKFLVVPLLVLEPVLTFSAVSLLIDRKDTAGRPFLGLGVLGLDQAKMQGILFGSILLGFPLKCALPTRVNLLRGMVSQRIQPIHSFNDRGLSNRQTLKTNTQTRLTVICSKRKIATLYHNFFSITLFISDTVLWFSFVNEA